MMPTRRWLSRGWIAIAILCVLPSAPLPAQSGGGASTSDPGLSAPVDRTTSTSDALSRLPIGFRRVDRESAEDSSSSPDPLERSLPLAPPKRGAAAVSAGPAPSAGRAIATVVSSLALVVGVLLVVAWFARKYQGPARGLPDELFLHLGSASLSGRQTVHVMRFGEKLILAATTSTGLQALAELTRPEDVQRLTALCRPTHASPIASKLNRVLAEWTHDSTDHRGSVRSSSSVVVAPTRMGEPSHA